MASNPTLSSKQRANVLRAYRYRGRRDQQLYLAYSVKTDRDWILPSNYRFLHWLLYLETDPDIITFELRDDSLTNKDDVSDWGRIHAWATTRAHCIVGHQILSDEQAKAVKSESSVLALREDGREVRPILESELRKKASLAMRYAKIVCYAATLRGQRLDSPTVLMSGIARSKRDGSVREILESMPDVDGAVVKGLIARLAILGWLGLDLSRQGFTLETRWQWEGTP